MKTKYSNKTETKAYKKAKVSLFPYISHPTDI